MLEIKVKRCLLFGNNRQLRVQPVGFPLNDTDIASFFGLIICLFLSCGEAYTPQRKKYWEAYYFTSTFFARIVGIVIIVHYLVIKKGHHIVPLTLKQERRKLYD